MTQPRRILVIGSSIAGISAAESARQQDPEAEITIVSQDEYAPYYRLRLCEVLDNPAVAESLYLHPDAWYEERRLRLLLGRRAVQADPAAHTVSLADGEVLSYDALILTTGSQSFVPPITGVHRPGVYTLWTMASALQIEQALRTARKAVVIGGGLLGLEAAYHIRRKGIPTTIIEKLPRLLANQLDENGSAIFEGRVRNLDVNVLCSADIVSIDGADGGEASPAASVRLADGTVIEADFVIVSIGVRADVELARSAGLTISRRIVTDEGMRTSSPDIYAAGDAAEPLEYWFGLWSVSRGQGQVAGINAAGGAATFDRTVPPYLISTMDTKVAVQGDKGAAEPQYELDVLMDANSGNYRKLIYREGVFRGFMLVGDTRDFVRLQKELGKHVPKQGQAPQG